MKNFINIVKIIAVICTIFIGLIFIKSCVNAFEFIKLMPDQLSVNDFVALLEVFILFPLATLDVIMPIIILILSIIFIPKIFKYLTDIQLMIYKRLKD